MNEKINVLRTQINTIDESLVENLKRRFEICKEIGDIKKQNGLPIEDLKREKEIIDNKVKSSSLNKDFTKNLFESIFKESKRLQK